MAQIKYFPLDHMFDAARQGWMIATDENEDLVVRVIDGRLHYAFTKQGETIMKDKIPQEEG